jgi:hypothetical protein
MPIRKESSSVQSIFEWCCLGLFTSILWWYDSDLSEFHVPSAGLGRQPEPEFVQY